MTDWCYFEIARDILNPNMTRVVQPVITGFEWADPDRTGLNKIWDIFSIICWRTKNLKRKFQKNGFFSTHKKDFLRIEEGRRWILKMRGFRFREKTPPHCPQRRARRVKLKLFFYLETVFGAKVIFDLILNFFWNLVAEGVKKFFSFRGISSFEFGL